MEYKLISVIMGVYNCASTLDGAVNCIINQTYPKWELIMCDDASTDDTYTVAKKYAQMYPDKISLLRNKKNHGLNYTLNKCLKSARGGANDMMIQQYRRFALMRKSGRTRNQY